MNHAKASNALVSLVDFYSTAIAELQETINSQAATIQSLGAQLKVMSNKPTKVTGPLPLHPFAFDLADKV